MEVSDVVSVLVYVGVAKGNGVLSKTGENYERQAGWPSMMVLLIACTGGKGQLS